MAVKAVTCVRSGKPMPLAFVLNEDDWRQIGIAAAEGMAGNVRRQVTAGGLAQRVNAQSTIKAKRNKGRAAKSLMDDPSSLRFALVGRYAVTADGKGVTIAPADNLTIARYVQKKGYVGWIAPSESAWKKIKAIIARVVKRAQQEASKHKKVR